MAAVATEIFKASRGSPRCPWFSAHPLPSSPHPWVWWLWVPSIRQTFMGLWHRDTKGIPIFLLTASSPSSTPGSPANPLEKTNRRPLWHTIDPTIYLCYFFVPPCQPWWTTSLQPPSPSPTPSIPPRASSLGFASSTQRVFHWARFSAICVDTWQKSIEFEASPAKIGVFNPGNPSKMRCLSCFTHTTQERTEQHVWNQAMIEVLWILEIGYSTRPMHWRSVRRKAMSQQDRKKKRTFMWPHHSHPSSSMQPFHMCKYMETLWRFDQQYPSLSRFPEALGSPAINPWYIGSYQGPDRVEIREDPNLTILKSVSENHRQMASIHIELLVLQEEKLQHLSYFRSLLYLRYLIPGLLQPGRQQSVGRSSFFVCRKSPRDFLEICRSGPNEMIFAAAGCDPGMLRSFLFHIFSYPSMLSIHHQSEVMPTFSWAASVPIKTWFRPMTLDWARIEVLINNWPISLMMNPTLLVNVRSSDVPRQRNSWYSQPCLITEVSHGCSYIVIYPSVIPLSENDIYLFDPSWLFHCVMYQIAIFHFTTMLIG